MQVDPMIEYVKSMFDYAFGNKAGKLNGRYTPRYHYAPPLYVKVKRYAGKGKARKAK